VRSSLSLPRPLIAAMGMFAALGLVPASPAQMLRPPSQAEGWQLLDEALVGLDQAWLQQLDPELWSDVRTTAGQALDAARRARDGGAPDDVCLAAQRTLQALIARQAVLETPPAEGEDAAADAAVLSTLEGLADDLLFVEGRLPETSLLLAEVLFGLQRDPEGQDVLQRALVLWPADVRVHESVRAWSSVLPSPENLINALQARVQSLGGNRPAASGLALETAGVLHGVLGTRAYEASDYAVAGLHFDASGKSLLGSLSMPRALPEDEIVNLRGDAAVNAAMSFLGFAQQVWFADRGEAERAPAAMLAAEESIVVAMRLRPEHEPTLNAVLFLGEAWKDKAHPDEATAADLADAREFFGRMAQRFDVADWWNNHAFWCRETATAAETAGDLETAHELYEQSYASYSRAIELAPDNARYVNDTGLILLYHLDRDLDHAEELFERAWRLGRSVCENPFADESVKAENLAAYGDAMLNLARLHLQRGEADEAKSINDQLLEVAPGRPDARLLAMQIDAAL